MFRRSVFVWKGHIKWECIFERNGMSCDCIFYGSVYFMGAYILRECIFSRGVYIFMGVYYIAIPGAAERSVQHLITRVWGARGASSSSLSS